MCTVAITFNNRQNKGTLLNNILLRTTILSGRSEEKKSKVSLAPT